LFKSTDRRWTDKDLVAVRECLVELFSTLYIDIKQRNLTFVLNCNDLTLCSAIEISVNFTPLDESVFINHLLKLIFADKEVVLTMNFAFTRSTSGIRNAELELVRILTSNRFQESSLTSSRWANHN